MAQENKELMLVDLCARLTCRTMIKCNTDGSHEFDEELTAMHLINFYQFEIKPYLRPMSSMTGAEVLEYISLKENIIAIDDITYYFETYESIDWLNKHHFDYRGLIEKGLALKALEGMYELKKEN